MISQFRRSTARRALGLRAPFVSPPFASPRGAAPSRGRVKVELPSSGGARDRGHVESRTSGAIHPRDSAERVPPATHSRDGFSFSREEFTDPYRRGAGVRLYTTPGEAHGMIFDTPTRSETDVPMEVQGGYISPAETPALVSLDERLHTGERTESCWFQHLAPLVPGNRP
jgi:hypothetical protein